MQTQNPVYIGHNVLLNSKVLAITIPSMSYLDNYVEAGTSNNVAYLYNSTLCGKSGDCTWAYSAEAKTLTISGNGNMNGYGTTCNSNYCYTSAPWGIYFDEIQFLVLEEGVTSIGSYAFYGCRNLSSISFPSSLTSIYYSAFQNCHALTEVSLPISVTFVKSGAFSYCNKLTSLVLNSTQPVELDGNIIGGCPNIKYIEIPDGTYDAYIAAGPDNSYYDVKNTTPHGLTGVCSWSYNTETKTLTISGNGNMHDYGNICNGDCYTSAPWNMYIEDLQNVIIEEGVTKIGSYSFQGCNSISSVVFANTLTEIGYAAFDGCKNLTSVTLPGSVTKVYGYAFSNCEKLSSLVMNSTQPVELGDYIVNNCPNVKYIEIPDGTYDAYIAVGPNNAYHDASNTTPHGITGDCSWSYNTETKTLTISGNGEMNEWYTTTCDGYCYTTAPWGLYFDEIQTLILEEGVTSIGGYAFYGCRRLSSISFPSSLTTIKYDAFQDCDALTEVSLPSNVTIVGNYAFADCDKLSSIVLNSTQPVELGGYIANNCPNIKYIEIPDGTYDTYIAAGPNNAYHDASNTTPHGITGDCSWLYNSDTKTLTISGSGEMRDYGNVCDGVCLTTAPWNLYLEDLQNVIIEEGVTVVSSYSFQGCKNISSVVFPNTLTKIGYSAFEGCKNLTSATLSGSVIKVYDNAFSNCSKLSSLVMNSTQPVELGSSIASGCPNIKYIEIPYGTLDTYLAAGHNNMYYDGSNTGKTGDCTWAYDTETKTLTISGSGNMNDYSTTCNKFCYTTAPWGIYFDEIQTLVLEEGVTSIGGYAFYGCRSLSSISFPSSLTTIKYDAFQDCDALTEVSLPSNVTIVGNYAFADCDKLSSIVMNSTQPVELGGFIANNCPNTKYIEIPDGTYDTYLAASPDNVYHDASNTTPHGITGDCSWLFNPDTKTLTISGSGEMRDYGNICDGYYCYTTAPWGLYFNEIQTLILEEGVTSIGGYAFYGCRSLSSISFPSSLTTIKYCAFQECDALTEVSLPSNVTNIGNYAFSNCDVLTSLIMNSTQPVELGENIIGWCQYAKYIEIPDGTYDTYIAAGPNNAYHDASNTTPHGITGDCSWSYDPDAKVLTISGNGNINDYGTTCANYCYTTAPWGVYFNEIQTLILEEGVTSIGGYAFYGCRSLSSISFPSSLTTIKYDAFQDCDALTEVSLPSNVTRVGSYAFADCDKLSSIVMNSTQPVELGDYIANNCPNIKYIEIPDGTYDIYNAANPNNAYHDASNTTPHGITGDCSWSYDPDTKTLTISGNGDMNGYGSVCNDYCYTTAPWGSFHEDIQNIVIEEGVTSIGSYSFHGCINVTSVSLPSSLSFTGWGVFENINNIDRVDYGGTIGEWCNIYWGAYSYGNYSDSWDSYMANPTWNGAELFIGGSALPANLTITENIQTIRRYAFYGVRNLETVVIKNAAPTIEQYAFAYCRNLKEIIIGSNYDNGNGSIESYAFYYSPIETAFLGEGINSLGDYVFMGFDEFYNPSTVLSSLTCMSQTPPSVTGNTFYVSNDDCTLFVPNGSNSSYPSTPVWSDFFNIEAATPAAIYGLSVSANGGSVMLGSNNISGSTLNIGKYETRTLVFVPDLGYSLLQVLFNGQDVTSSVASDGSFTTPAMTADATISVSFIPTIYKVSMFTVGSGVHFVSKVVYGNDFSIFIEIEENRNVESITVNGTDMTAEILDGDGCITLQNITSDQTIIVTMEGSEDDGTQTDIYSLSVNKSLRAWKADNNIFVEATEDTKRIDVYDISGKIVRSVANDGYGVVTLGVDKGVHIVRTTLSNGSAMSKKL